MSTGLKKNGEGPVVPPVVLYVDFRGGVVHWQCWRGGGDGHFLDFGFHFVALNMLLLLSTYVGVYIYVYI